MAAPLTARLPALEEKNPKEIHYSKITLEKNGQDILADYPVKKYYFPIFLLFF